MDPQALSGPIPPATGTPPVDAAPSPGGAAMASPQQKQELMDMIGMIEGKLGEVNAAMISGKNVSEQARMDALKNVFSIMQKNGVDLTDPQSVAAFLDKIKQQNPEFSEFLEQILDHLLGGAGPAPRSLQDLSAEVAVPTAPPTPPPGMEEGGGGFPPPPPSPMESGMPPPAPLPNEALSQTVPGPVPPSPQGALG